MFTRLGPLSPAVPPRVPVPHVRGVPTIIQESVWLHHENTVVLQHRYAYYYGLLLLLLYDYIVADCSTVFFFTVKLHQGFFILVSRLVLVLSLVFLFGCHIKNFWE